jgi:hypothetical protein
MKPPAEILVTDMKVAVSAADRDLEIQRVASYRLYRLDGARKVASAEWIEADDDSAAIEAAKERFGRNAFELWQGRRLVERK